MAQQPNNGTFGKPPKGNIPSASSSPAPKAPQSVGSGSTQIYPESQAAIKALSLPVTDKRPKGV